MKRNSKKNKRIRSLVLVCVLSALLLTVGTYAWFIGMQTVKVNSFEIEIASVDSLQLSLDGTTWTTTLDVLNNATPQYEGNANQFLQGENEGLKPISTIGEFDETVSRLKLYEKGSLTATKGGYRLMASRVNNYNALNDDNKVTATGEYVEDDGYVAFDLFIMNLSGDEYYPTNDVANEEAIYLTYDSKVTAGTSGVTNSGIENSVRVGFAQIARVSASKYGVIGADETDKLATVTKMACGQTGDVTSICRTAQIWEPNENTHVADAVTWYNKTCKARKATVDGAEKSFAYDTAACAKLDEYIKTAAVAGVISEKDFVDVYDVSYNGYTQVETTKLSQVDTFTDTEKLVKGENRNQFMTLAPNSITKVRVYVWIEGQDIDNYDFAALGHSIKVNFGFTKERITSGEINENITPDSELNAEQLPTENQTPVVEENTEEGTEDPVEDPTE